MGTENGSELLNVFLAPGVLVGKTGGKEKKEKRKLATKSNSVRDQTVWHTANISFLRVMFGEF